jgi:hypothetical protein
MVQSILRDIVNFDILLYPFWLLQGKGYLKAQLIQRCDINISTLPYNQTTVDYINKCKKAGTRMEVDY